MLCIGGQSYMLSIRGLSIMLCMGEVNNMQCKEG
jgi:hypothetical protein